MTPHELFPREVTSNVPYVTLTGDGLLHIEQHRGLMTCQPEEVCFRTALGLMTVTGRGLHFRRYSSAEAMLAGEIEAIRLIREGGRS